MVSSLLAFTVCLIAPQAEPQEAFDARMNRTFQASGVPGAVVRVWKDGKTVYESSYGVADLDTKVAASQKFAFEIGSLSKQFVAVCALMLVKEGKLKLDEPIGQVLDGLPEAWRPATIDQIMHHMSGIPDYEEIAGYDFYNLPRKPEDIIAEAKKKEPAFKIGDRFEYSNTGYYLISRAVEKRSGLPLAKFMKERLFDPLGMTSTYTDTRPAGVTPMTGYHSRTGLRVKQPPIAWSSTLGAGGIVSTLDDMMKWDQALYTDKLLDQTLLSKIWSSTKYNNGQTNNYGYGWITTAFRGQRELNHSGQTNGFTCIYRRYPEQKMSVLAFANTYGGNVFGLARAAQIRYIPGLDYRLLTPATNADADRTKQHLDYIRRAVFGTGDLSVLAPNVRDLATLDRFAETRKQLQEMLGENPSLEFIRLVKRTAADGSEIEDYLYRHTLPTGKKYWTLGINKGKVSGLLVEDE